MVKEEVLEFPAVVMELLPNATFRVRLDNGHEIVAHTAGKIRKNRIRVLTGDRVQVEMTLMISTVVGSPTVPNNFLCGCFARQNCGAWCFAPIAKAPFDFGQCFAAQSFLVTTNWFLAGSDSSG